MIYGVFHQGSGLGNQLHRYIATRVLALDKGYDFGMHYREDGSGKEHGFKGKGFMNIDLGKSSQLETDAPLEAQPVFNWFNEKKIVENGVDVRSYDPEINFVEDNTVIDGDFQDERYWEHREKEVDEWLKVEPLEMPDDLCVIGFRGGEFSIYPDLFLTYEYWNKGIYKMLEINKNMRFEIHTDDKNVAEQFFNAYFVDSRSPLFNKNVKIIHDIGLNWRSMRYAKYAIIANSSFFIMPRWLNKGFTIAPRYWGRRNTKVWSLNQNYYKRFTYL